MKEERQNTPMNAIQPPAHKRSVWIDSYQIPVYTDLKRADEILYATDTQILGKPKKNYFAMVDLGAPTEEVVSGELKKRSFNVLSAATENALTPWRRVLPESFRRGAEAAVINTARQAGAFSIKTGLALMNKMGEAAAAGTGGAYIPTEADRQRAQEEYQRSQKWADDFNNKVKAVVGLFTKRAGLEKTQKDGFLYDLGSGAGSVLTSIAALAITRNPAIMSAIFGAAEGQGTYEQAIEAGVEPVKAYKLGLSNAAWIAATEFVGDKLFLKLLNVNGVLDKFTSKALKSIKKKPLSVQGGTAVAIGAARGAMIEGVQETTQSIGSNVINDVGGVEDTSWREKAKQALYEGFIAFILGGVPGGAAAGGNFFVYRQNIAKNLMAAGVKEEEAHKVATELANTAISEDFTKEALGSVSGEINSPLTAEDRDAGTFKATLTQAQQRKVERNAWDAREQLKKEAQEAGMSEEEAEQTAEIAHANQLAFYRLTGIAPEEMRYMKIDVLGPSQTEQSPLVYNQEAMYRSPAKTLAEFIAKVNKEEGQAKNSYFTIFDNSAFRIDLKNTTVKHDKKHPNMISKRWEDVCNHLDNISDYTFASEKLKQGQIGTILLKIQGAEGKYGVALDVYENGRVLLESAFDGTDTTLDQWIEEQRTRNRKKKAPVVGDTLSRTRAAKGANNSIAEIVDKIKTGDTFNQAAAAMYRNPARSLAEFKDFAQENQKNPKEKNKSFYAFDAGGVEVHVPFERAIHIDNGHQLTDQQLSAVEKELGIFEYAVQMPGVGEYNGKQVKFKGNTSQGKIGGVLEISQNGRVFLDTVFFGTDADIDNWAKENPSNAPSKKPVFISRGTISIAEIVDKIKTGDTFNQAAAAMYKSPHNDFAKFYEAAQQNKEGKQSYYTHTTQSGVEIQIPSDTVLHDKKHPEMTAEVWTDVLNNIDNIERAVVPANNRSGKYMGHPILLKIKGNKGFYGVVFESLPNGRLLATTAFQGTGEHGIDAWLQSKEGAGTPAQILFSFRRTTDNSRKGTISSHPSTISIAEIVDKIKTGDTFNQAAAMYIDNWAKNEPLQRPSHKKPVLVGSGIDNSIAGLQDFVKTQEMFAPDSNTLWQEGKNLFAPDETVARKFKADVKAVLSDKNTPNNTKVDMGVIPPLYEKLGLPKQELKTNKLALRKALGLLTQEELKADKNLHNHNVPQEVVENLPKLLADPVAVFRSNTKPGAYVAVLNEKAGKDQIVAILRPSPKENGFTFIPTVYEHGKFDKFVESTVRKNNVVYIDKNRMSLPEPLIQAGTIGKNILTNSIRTKEDFVKGKLLKYNKNYQAKQEYYQSRPAPRGSVTIDEEANRAIIKIFQKGDASTIVHELAHVQLAMLARARGVSADEEFAQLTADLDAWLGAPEENGRYSTPQQEKFAQGFEGYLAAGKAPNKQLESVFEKFAQWLAEIYQAAKEYLKITPEVKSIFDRLLAPQAQIQKSKIGSKLDAAKKLVEQMKRGQGMDFEGLSIQDIKELLKTLSVRKPAAPKQDLLKDLRKHGAEYANAGKIDKEAYKNAKIYDKKGGVDDRPDVWLQKHGYMEFEESTEETLAAAYDLIQRALAGEKVYRIEDQVVAQARAAFEENMATILQLFPDIKTAQETLKSIVQLEKMGYRAVEAKDLELLRRTLSNLETMAGQVEAENTKLSADAVEKKRQKFEQDALRIKKRVMAELDKRQLAHKEDMKKLLKHAKTPQEIHDVLTGILEQMEAAWAQTDEGKRDLRKLAVPDTNWDKVRVELLKRFNDIAAAAQEEVRQAQQTLSKLPLMGILSEEQAAAKEKAEKVLKESNLDGKYVMAMQAVLRGIPHITYADVAKYSAVLARSNKRYRLLTEKNINEFINHAKKMQERNYKKYMRGKLSALFNRKTYEKLGSVKRAKYTPYMLKFLEDAAKIWGGSQQAALRYYEAAVEGIDPDNPPSVFQALINRVLWIKADPGGEVTMQDLHAFYEDALAAVRGDAAQKRLDGERRAVQEANIRLAACLSLKERKLPKGIVTYLLHGGVDLQTFIDIAFGQYETDMYESDPLPSRAEQSLAALKKIAAGSEEETVPGLRPDFVQYGGTPDVTFIWGDNNKGLQHIAPKHGADILPQVIDTVVAGRVERFTASKKTLVLQKGNIEAVLSLDEHGKQKTWLLTGWDATSPKGNKKRTDANGQVSTGSAATQTLPTFSRQDLGAVLNNSIAQKEPVNKGLKKHKINFREEPASPLKNELPQDAKPVTVLTGQEIPNLNTADAKTRKSSILEWFRKTLAPVTSTRKDLGEISYPVNSAREVLGRSLDMEKIQLFPAIKDVVEKGVLLNNGQINKTPEHKGGIVGFYYIQGKVQLPEGIKTVQVDIAENELGKKFYFYSEIKETPGLDTLSRTRAVPEVNNSIAQKEGQIKAGKWKINFRDILAPETNQIKEAVFNAQINKDILRAVGTAYQLKTSQQILDKIAEMQKDTMQLTNYAFVKDQANGEVIATLFKNGKPITYNAPRVQTINRLEALTFWIWNQNHIFVDTANGAEDYGLSGRLHYAYGSDQLGKLFAWLTPQDVQAAKNLQELVEKHYEQESQVHQRIYGFKLPKVEFYFPSVTERITDTIDLKQEFVQNSKSPSFIKKRVTSRRVIQRIVNPIDLALKHLRRAGEFIFEAENYAANKRIFKDRDVESAFLEKFGQQDGKKLYSKFMALLDQQAPQKAQVKDEFYSVMNKLFNGWVKAVMGLKPITGIKQFASSVSFAENMPWDLWTKWFAEGLTNPRKTADFMLKASPYIQARYDMGGMNEYTARAMASDEVAPIKSRWNTFTNFMLINTRLGDKASLIYGGYPYMKYLLEVKGLSQQEAARVFEKQATRTLQSSLRVHLSQGQANADSFGARVFLVFKNQQLQYVRKVVDAYVQFKNGEISRSQFAKTAFIYLILNPMVYTALGIGWFAADDDDREEDLKNLLTSPVSQFFGAYPFGEGVAGFFVDNAASLVSEGKLTAPRQMGLPMFDDITRDVAKAVKTVNADELDTMEFINIFLAVAKYTGLPTQSVMNMGGGLVDIVTGKPVRGSLRAVGYTQNRAGKITGDKE